MYYEVVRKPMWVSKIRNQIAKYTSMEAFRADMAQIWENAMVFNKDDSDYYKWAVELRDYFEQVYAERMAELEAQRAAAASEVNVGDEDVAMTPGAASSTTGGGDDSYSGASGSRPKLKVTLNRNPDSNASSPAPSKRGRGKAPVRGGRGGSRMGRKRIDSDDDDADDQDAQGGEESESDD
jgi:hypothetical protein